MGGGGVHTSSMAYNVDVAELTDKNSIPVPLPGKSCCAETVVALRALRRHLLMHVETQI